MTLSQFQQLVERYIAGQCPAAEKETLYQLLQSPEYISQLEMIMDEQLAENTASAADYPGVVNRLKQAVAKEINNEQPAKVRRLHYVRWAAAAAVILMIGLSVFWWLSPSASKQGSVQETIVQAGQDIAPGKEGAILTFDDGSSMVIDSLGNGVITTKDGAKVLLKNGLLSYKNNLSLGEEMIYNTMTTPKGRQFRLQLQDGTQVWLNAASSIRYPVSFSGKERRVEITGEAYFEVAKNAAQPFLVKINDETEIEVLGTHFNVNSYTNESSINTTLLEGSVKIRNGSENVIILPGQQAQVNIVQAQQKIKVVNNADIEKVMAWKNGVFDFQDARLHDVMRQIERWYDIDVVYEKNVPELEFMGKMGRDLTLQKVLRGLEVSEVHFRVEGRKLIVTP